MSVTSIRTVVVPAAQMSTQVPSIRIRTHRGQAQDEQYSNQKLPPEFIEAYHDALKQGITDSNAIRDFLQKKFQHMTPASLRNMIINETILTMCELPTPHADTPQRAAIARRVAGGGFAEVGAIVNDGTLESKIRFNQVEKLADAALMLYNPEEPPPPPPDSGTIQVPGNMNKPFIGTIKKSKENELERETLEEKRQRLETLRARAAAAKQQQEREAEEQRKHLNNLRSSVAASKETIQREREKQRIKSERRRIQLEAIAAAQEEQRQLTERLQAEAIAAQEKLRREQEAFQRICEERNARRIRAEEEERISTEATLSLISAFPIEEMNTIIGVDGYDSREETLRPINYRRGPGVQSNRVTIGFVLQRIQGFAKRNTNVNDMTVHIMALFTILYFISEHFYQEEGTLTPNVKRLIQRLKYLSSYKHRKNTSDEEDHSRIMRTRPLYTPEEEEERAKPGFFRSIGQSLGLAATQVTRAPPVPINASTMFIDPIVAEFLDQDIHPSILVFLFPSRLSNIHDVNLLIQGNIISLLYKNELDKYLDMRSMCISLYKRVNYILNKFFWEPPERPNLFAVTGNASTYNMTFTPTRESSNERSSHEKWADNMREWQQIVNNHDRRYGITTQENRKLEEEYNQDNVKAILGGLLREFQEHTNNVKDYSGWETWTWGTKTFFVVSSMAQLSEKVIGMHNSIQQNIKQREAYLSKLNAYANTQKGFDPADAREQEAAKAEESKRSGPVFVPEAERTWVSTSAANNAEGKRTLNRIMEQEEFANTQQSFDPAEVRRQQIDKALESNRFGPEHVPQAERNWVNTSAANAAEGERVIDEILEREYRTTVVNELLTRFSENFVANQLIQSRANELDQDAFEAIATADTTVDTICAAKLLNGGAGNLIKLPTYCATGNPLTEAITRGRYKSDQTKVEENKVTREVFVNYRIITAQDKASNLNGELNTAHDVIRSAVEGIDKVTSYNNMGREAFDDLVRRASDTIDGLDGTREEAAKSLISAENVIANVRNAPEAVGANNAQDVKTLLSMDSSVLAETATAARADVNTMEQARSNIKAVEKAINDVLLLANVAISARDGIGGVGGKGGGNHKPSEPQQVDSDANYAIAIMPGAVVNPEIIEGDLGSSPHLLKGTNSRGEVRYVAVKGKNIDKVQRANFERGIQPGQAPRKVASPELATLKQGWEIAGPILRAEGVPLPSETLYTRGMQFHPFVKPDGNNLLQPQFDMGTLPAMTGGLSWRALDTYNVVGVAHSTGEAGWGGFVRARGGGLRRAHTRVHMKRMLRNKTRKLQGGAVSSSSSLQELCESIWKLRSYTDINIFRFCFKTLLGGMNEVKKQAREAKNPCL